MCWRFICLGKEICHEGKTIKSYKFLVSYQNDVKPFSQNQKHWDPMWETVLSPNNKQLLAEWIASNGWPHVQSFLAPDLLSQHGTVPSTSCSSSCHAWLQHAMHACELVSPFPKSQRQSPGNRMPWPTNNKMITDKYIILNLFYPHQKNIKK